MDQLKTAEDLVPLVRKAAESALPAERVFFWFNPDNPLVLGITVSRSASLDVRKMTGNADVDQKAVRDFIEAIFNGKFADEPA